MIRVMLVDDHPVVRAGLRAILNAFPDIDVAWEGANGQDAITTVRAHPGDIDVVVMDLQMPGVDGISATATLSELSGPPVLVLTTYDTQSDIVAAIRAGALGYLLKDAPEEVLHQAVLDTAARKRTLSAEVAQALATQLSFPDEALSQREIEILTLVATGASNKDIAADLFISLATVKTHLIHIYRKLRVDNRTAAVNEARRRGVLHQR
ncbi:response regulator [Corynebacterium poyangense]|uniref:Response regulator n=1 Tax=Corynebacterium poyangense TaxID=2684405 RepID=A0A7H0SRP5_9CORY|nr:response regulator transcription factor [Corynebacterium poyangense]MBZ8176653.1 response regulator [Corynebacterium poyangense]QNQ91220.1 response regulator [Corynebacterium poyangense]